MFDPTMRFDSLREQVMDSIANGIALADITRRGEGLAGMATLPAALTDSCLMDLAANKPHARLLSLPRSAFISSEHQQVRGNTLQPLRMMMVTNLGEPIQVHLDQAAQGDGGLLLRRRVVTPLKTPRGLPLEALIKYYPEERVGRWHAIRSARAWT